MGSFKHPRAFQPLDLEIIDRVYGPLGRRLKRPTHSAIERRMASGERHYVS